MITIFGSRTPRTFGRSVISLHRLLAPLKKQVVCKVLKFAPKGLDTGTFLWAFQGTIRVVKFQGVDLKVEGLNLQTMSLLSNTTQFNQMTELQILVPCQNCIEPQKYVLRALMLLCVTVSTSCAVNALLVIIVFLSVPSTLPGDSFVGVFLIFHGVFLFPGCTMHPSLSHLVMVSVSENLYVDAPPLFLG